VSFVQRWLPEFSAALRGERHAAPKRWLIGLVALFLLLLPFAPTLARWLAASLN
jgi:hypothetical protein